MNAVVSRVNAAEGPMFPLSAHYKSVQLVAVRIAEVGGVEAVKTLARRAFIGGAVLHGALVDAVDMGPVAGSKRHHHAIADRGRLAIKGLGEADAGAAAGHAPGDELVAFHHAAG